MATQKATAEQTLAARRVRKALAVLVQEYPKVFEAANREDEGWDGDPTTQGLVSLDEMYDTLVEFEDGQAELSEPKC